MNTRDCITAFASIAVSAALAGSVLAQVRPPSPEEILRLSPSMQLSVQAMGDEPCEPSKPSPTEKQTQPVQAIIVQGVTVFEGGHFNEQTKGLNGHKVSLEALNRVVEGVVCGYRARGFVFAHATLRPGAGGVWTIDVNEGALGQIESAVDDPRIAHALRRAFIGLQPGKPINANDVRRGLVVANTLGLADVRPTVRRSRVDPKLLDVVLVVASAPAPTAELQVENLNSRTLGRTGALAAFTFNGVTPLYDRTSVGVFQSLERTGQTTFQASSHALAPFIDAGMGADFAYSRALPRGTLAPLDIDSRSWFGRLSLDHVFIVRRGLITQASAGLEGVDQSTDFLGGVPFIRDRLRIAFVKAQGEALAFGGVFNGAAEVRKGLRAFGALSSDASLPSVAGADPQALVVRLNASYSRSLGPIGLTASVRGQYSDRTLDSFEQMTFGSLNGGQGFDPATIAGDRGVATNLEAQGPPIKGPLGMVLRPYVFSDAARITTVTGTADGRWAVSAGGGLRITTPQHLAFSLTYAAPINSGGAPADSYGPRILFGFNIATDDPISRLANIFTKRTPKP